MNYQNARTMVTPGFSQRCQIRKDVDPLTLYQPIDTIGVGSYGSVLKAIDKETQKTVAVKLVKVEDPLDWKYVLQEVEFLTEVSGDNITNYHGAVYCKEAQELWIVMELCELGSIMDIMERTNSTLTEDQIAFVMHETVKGLRSLHDVKMIHRDIKAGNIMVTKDGEVKLGDFGVAAKISETETKRKTCIGTPYWMAPEVIIETGHDERADVWSLGITAIEMLQGHPPNSNLPPMRALFQISRSPSPPSPDDASSCSSEFLDFVGVCLTRNPEERPTCAKLLEHPYLQRGATLRDQWLKVVDFSLAVADGTASSAQSTDAIEMSAPTIVRDQKVERVPAAIVTDNENAPVTEPSDRIKNAIEDYKTTKPAPLPKEKPSEAPKVETEKERRKREKLEKRRRKKESKKAKHKKHKKKLDVPTNEVGITESVLLDDNTCQFTTQLDPVGKDFHIQYSEKLRADSKIPDEEEAESKPEEEVGTPEAEKTTESSEYDSGTFIRASESEEFESGTFVAGSGTMIRGALEEIGATGTMMVSHSGHGDQVEEKPEVDEQQQAAASFMSEIIASDKRAKEIVDRGVSEEEVTAEINRFTKEIEDVEERLRVLREALVLSKSQPNSTPSDSVEQTS